MAAKLAKQTARAAGIPNGMRTATVTAVGASGITVSVNGALISGLATLDSTTPAVGDTVTVFKQDQTWLIMGRPSQGNGQWVTATLLNSFTNIGAPALSVRRAASNDLRVYGWVVSGATTGSGTAIAQVSGELASSVGHAPALTVYNTTSGVNMWLALALNATTGFAEMQLHGTWANGNSVLINGFWPLDL